MKQYACVIWDWNGTLADDVGASLRSVNDILARRNMPPINMEQYYSYLDTPISRFYAHLFDLSVVPMEQLAVEFNAGYAKYFEGLHRGVPELLQGIRDRNIPQVILTSGNNRIIDADLRRLGIREFFDAILGADDLMATGKTQRGLDWIARQAAAPEDMVMIGDSLHDLDAARAMGVDCILCSFGHQAESDLRATGYPVVTEFTQLRELLLPAPAAV